MIERITTGSFFTNSYVISNEGKCVIDCDLCAECGACEAECPFEAIKEVDESETEQK